MWGDGSRLALQGQVIADNGRSLEAHTWESAGWSLVLKVCRRGLKWGCGGCIFFVPKLGLCTHICCCGETVNPGTSVSLPHAERRQTADRGQETEVKPRETPRASGRHASAAEQSSLRHWCFPSSFLSHLTSKCSTNGGLPVLSRASLSRCIL